MAIETVSDAHMLELGHPILWANNIVGSPLAETPPAIRVEIATGTEGHLHALKKDLLSKQDQPNCFTTLATFMPTKDSLPFDAADHENLTYLGIDHEHLTLKPGSSLTLADFEETSEVAHYVGEQRVGSWAIFLSASKKLIYGHQYSLGRVVLLPATKQKEFAIARAELGAKSRRGKIASEVKFLPGRVRIGEVQHAPSTLMRVNQIDILQYIPPRKR